MLSKDIQPRQLTNLHLLNTDLLHLNPSISGITVSMFQVKGATNPMLDDVIRNNNTQLVDGMKRSDILDALKPGLITRVNTFPITFGYESHGDKHFPGGPPGSKFTAGKLQVNPLLENLMTPHIGRIRRDANGQQVTYYLSAGPITYSGGQGVIIQLTIIPGHPEKIEYHGYPGNPVRHVLSRQLAGAPIAM